MVEGLSFDLNTFSSVQLFAPVWPHVFAFSLVVTSLRLELDSSAGHDSGSQGVAVILLLLGEAQDVESILGVLEFFIVIDGLHLYKISCSTMYALNISLTFLYLSLSLGYIDVVTDSSRQTLLLIVMSAGMNDHGSGNNISRQKNPRRRGDIVRVYMEGTTRSHTNESH